MARRWCWCSAKSGAMIAGTFTLTISAVQLILQVVSYAAYGIDLIVKSLVPSLYLGLAIFDLIIILVSVIMMYQNDKQGRPGALLAWLIIVGLYIVYEAAVNIFNLVVLGAVGAKVDYQGSPLTLVLLPIVAIGNQLLSFLYGLIVYWGLKLLMYISAMLAVGSRYKDLKEAYDTRDSRTDTYDRRSGKPPSQPVHYRDQQPQYNRDPYRQSPPQNFAYQQQNGNYGYNNRY